jgi:hypothetical protein
MIAAFIFLLHFCAVVYAFVKYKKDGIGEGFLAVAFVVIIFAVGWTISTMITKIVYPDVLVARWIAGLQATRYSRMVAKELTIDTFSLVLLTIGEGFFYYFYLPAGEDEEKKKQNDNGNE